MRLYVRRLCGAVHTLRRSPTAMEECGEFAGHRDARPFLRVLAAARGEREPPAPPITVGPKRAEHVLRAAHEQATEPRIPRLVSRGMDAARPRRGVGGL
jgi:hypothetical protein